jgi:WD40 repeat protein
MTDAPIVKLPKSSDWYCSVAFSPAMEWIACSGYGQEVVTLHPIAVIGDASKSKACITGAETAGREDNKKAGTPAWTVETPQAVPVVSVSSPTSKTPTQLMSADVPRAPPSANNRLALASPRDKNAMLSMGTVKFGSAPNPQRQQTASMGQEPVSRAISTDHSSGFTLKVNSKEASSQRSALAMHVPRVARNTHAVAGQLGEDVINDYIRLMKKQTPLKLQHGDGVNNEVLTLAMGPDGDSVVAGGEDNTVILWDIEHRHKIMEANMHSSVKAVAFAPDGRFISAGDEDGFVNIWKTQVEGDMCEEAGSTNVDGSVLSMALTSQPCMLAVGTTCKKVSLFRVPALEDIIELRHDGDVHSLAFTPDGTMLAGGGGTDDMHGLMTKKLNSEGHAMKVVLWRVSQKAEDCQFVGAVLYEDVVRAVAFCPSQKLLAVGDESRKISVLVVDEKFECGGVLTCAAGVRCLSFSHDSRFLASGGEDMQISVWDLMKETVIFQLPKAKDWFCGVAFSPLNNWLATCGFGDSSITLYPIEGGSGDPDAPSDDENKAPAAVPAAPSMQISSSAPILLQPTSPGNNGDHSHMHTPMNTQNLIGAGTCKWAGTPVAALEAASAAPNDNAELTVPAGKADNRKKTIVTLGAGLFSITVKADKSGYPPEHNFKHMPHIMRELHGEELESFYLDTSDPKLRQQVSLQHKDEVMSLAFSSDACKVVAGGEDKKVILWSIEDQKPLMEMKMDHSVRAVAYAPSELHIAGGDEDGTIVVWDCNTKEEAATAQVEGSVMSMAMSSRTDFLAVGTSAKTVTLYSVPQLEEIVSLHHDGDVRSLCFSPDGKMLAGGGGTDKMHGLMTHKDASHKMKSVLWQVDSIGDNCQHLGTIESDDIVHCVSFSPSGEVLATGGEGRTISLLLVRNNFEKTGDLTCPAGVRSISWSPDSHFLASGGEDMQVSVWDLLTEQVVFQLPKAKDWLCAVAFSPARTKELWIATCGFGSDAVDLFPVTMRLLTEQPLQADGAPKRRNSLGRNQ